MTVLCYDWFSCTLPMSSEYFVDDVIETGLLSGLPFSRILGIESAVFEVSGGVKGYDKKLYFDGINIHLPRMDNPTANIWLEMSGQGCRAFETYGNGDWERLFTFARKYCNITRLDVACDDHDGILNMRTMLDDYYFKGNYVSKCRHHEVHMSWEDDKKSEWRKGITLDFGSNASDVFVRIYDKAAQLNRPGEHWVRCEIQLRHKRASQFLSMSGDIGNKYSGILNNTLRFVVASNDSNRWRWPLTDYWSEFVGDASKIKWPESPGVTYNMERLESWLVSQVGNSLYTFFKTYGSKALEKLIDDTRTGPLPAKYIEVINKFYADHNGSYTESDFIKSFSV